MHFRSMLTSVALVLATLGMSGVAIAHTRVVASTPTEGSTVARPRILTITFNEALLPPTVAASIVMTAMPSMANHSPMVIRNFTTKWSNGNRTLTMALRKPLTAGSYEARWQAAGADGHRMSGMVSFKVK